MNKQDKIIVALLVLMLFGWIFSQNSRNNAQQRGAAAQQSAVTNAVPNVTASQEALDSAVLSSPASTNLIERAAEPAAETVTAEPEPVKPPVKKTNLPEQIVMLSDDEVEVEVSSKGATIKSVALKSFRAKLEEEAPVCFNYSNYPALAIAGIEGFEGYNDFVIANTNGSSAQLFATNAAGVKLSRTITLMPDYKIDVEDRFSLAAGSAARYDIPSYSLSIGMITNIGNEAHSLSVDTLSALRSSRGKLGDVLHWEKEEKLVNLFTDGRGGGCFGSMPDSAGLKKSASVKSENDPQEWIALKSRFFALIFTSKSDTASPSGYEIMADRSLKSGPLSINHISGKYLYPSAALSSDKEIVNKHSLYVGPKKYSIIKEFAPESGEIMEFGFSKWLCIIMLPILNGLYFIFRNYGVAIIVLTILVRVIFWPLTRKSNENMKKMASVQPKIKEIQAKFKDDPQKMQQEMMIFYRENKINPMASCLPMLVQIPVFIALFVVLRGATELRFASFLWIADLSEPENLLKGVIPGVPALNILPFVMAGTMFLQSKLTPSMGDPKQHRMMMWMMPLMMFFMFYSMPSALLLYWSVSQLLAIIQLVRQRRSKDKATVKIGEDGVIEGEVMTRQERRRIARK